MKEKSVPAIKQLKLNYFFTYNILKLRISFSSGLFSCTNRLKQYILVKKFSYNYDIVL